ncbi:MAG: ribonuclease P protein component [Deltaproteobacteria bacterium]|nr:ribonuclease P protein component [Deltaproteobacteria bacterium]
MFYSFPKKNKLRKRKDYLRVQGRKTSKFVTGSMVFLYVQNQLDHARIGITVSKRNGNSVKRNKIKRFLRNTIRYCFPLMRHLGYDIVVIPRNRIKKTDLDEAITEMETFIANLDGDFQNKPLI